MNMWIIIKCIIGTKGGNLGLKHEGNKEEVVNLLDMGLLHGMKENYKVMFKMKDGCVMKKINLYKTEGYLFL